MLTHLVYASRAREGLLLSEVTPIISRAREGNGRRGITGLLVFDGQYLLQALEGGRQEVNELFQKLSRDPRHSDVTVLSYGPIVERAFSNWAMELITAPEKKILWRCSSTDAFDPYDLSPESAVHLLAKLGQERVAESDRRGGVETRRRLRWWEHPQPLAWDVEDAGSVLPKRFQDAATELDQ